MQIVIHKNLTFLYINIANPNPNPTGPSTPQYGNHPENFNKLIQGTRFICQVSRLPVAFGQKV